MKQVFITGASSGIGAELAILLAERGYELILTARRENLLLEIAKQCEELGALRVDTICGDINSVSVETHIDQYLSGEGEIVLVNNAGIAEFDQFFESNNAKSRSQLETNLLAPIFLTRSVLPLMLNAGSGQIINVLSIAAKSVFTGAAIYSASKAGLLQFGNVIREEYRRQGIRVTQVIPGATNTPIWGMDTNQGPPREKMLTSRAVADAIYQVIASPADRVIEEVVLTPPDGIL